MNGLQLPQRRYTYALLPEPAFLGRNIQDKHIRAEYDITPSVSKSEYRLHLDWKKVKVYFIRGMLLCRTTYVNYAQFVLIWIVKSSDTVATSPS
jgi:hypothetical protein